MTFGSDPELLSSSYVGFDFGSSNSSFSMVSQNDMEVYAERANNRSWLSLGDLVPILPYPASVPLARYLAEANNDKRENLGREVIEGVLSIVAYISYLEWCSLKKNKQTSYFKGLPHRSAGPLWALTKHCLSNLDGNARFSRKLIPFIKSSAYQEIEEIVDKIADGKHGKLSAIDYPSAIRTMANLLANALSDLEFGSFENVTKRPFSSIFTGTFRSAKGNSRPFISLYEYEGPKIFSEEAIYICDIEKSIALDLSPLMFWAKPPSSSPSSNVDLYLYDSAKLKENSLVFKAVQPREGLTITSSGEFKAVYDVILTMRSNDPDLSVIDDVALRRGDDDTEE